MLQWNFLPQASLRRRRVRSSVFLSLFYKSHMYTHRDTRGELQCRPWTATMRKHRLPQRISSYRGRRARWGLDAHSRRENAAIPPGRPPFRRAGGNGGSEARSTMTAITSDSPSCECRKPRQAGNGEEGERRRRVSSRVESRGKRWGALKTRIRENSAASMQYIW